MDKKWIFLLNVNKDTNENLYRHLIEIKKPSPPPGPPPLQSSKSMASSQDNGNLGKSINGFSKGQRDADSSIREWGTNPYSSFVVISSPPLMHLSSSIYSPSIGSEGSIQSVSKHMEGQYSSYT